MKSDNYKSEFNHIDKALEKAQYYQSIGKKELADKFFKIAERYEQLINKQREENEKRKQKKLYG